MGLFGKLHELLERRKGDSVAPDPAAADATEFDDLIVQTDNSGEEGQPVEDQDPNYVPEGSVR